jgi:hypothetical protein
LINNKFKITSKSSLAQNTAYLRQFAASSVPIFCMDEQDSAYASQSPIRFFFNAP